MSKQVGKIVLYQFEGCPFCVRVRVKLDELGFQYDTVDVSVDRNDPTRKDLKKFSNVPTVPVIQHGDKYIGDSDRIIEYLESL